MKLKVTTLILLSGLLAFANVSTSFAQADGAVMTDSHIQRIKQNCRSATNTIQQIHTNDGPLRVNRGQVYDSLSSKLMTPLNSRLILNKLDASALVKLTAQYDKTLNEFRDNYKNYDNQMSNVLTIDCTKQPVRFYDAVAEARRLRGVVYSNVTKLSTIIKEYGDAFTTFRTQFNSGQDKGDQ